jgi:hypothetical protein
MDTTQTFAAYLYMRVTGYNRVEGNRRASRTGLVSDLPPETPHVTDAQPFSSLYFSLAPSIE